MRSTSRWIKPCTVTTRSRSCSTDGAQGLEPGTMARAMLCRPEPSGLTGSGGGRKPPPPRSEDGALQPRDIRHWPLGPATRVPRLPAGHTVPPAPRRPLALHASSGMSWGSRGWYPPRVDPCPLQGPVHGVQNSHPLLWPARVGGLPTAARWQAEPAANHEHRGPGLRRGARLTRVNTR